MTETDELRRMLDERGIEYETDDAQVSETEWYYVTKLRDGYRDRWTYEEPPDCDLLVSYQYDLGAEDAVAATVGASERTTTRHGKYKTKYGRKVPLCECCGYSIGDGRWHYCPSCGAKVVDE